LNVYDELGIDPSEPTASIKDRLSRIKANDATRASRSDAAGEAARARISQIEEIEPSFIDDTSRQAYDQSLRSTPPVEKTSGPDWLQLAWAYYAQGDFGPAEVAARRAREADRDNPDVWVVSAWIALAPITRHPLASDESWDDVLKRFQREDRTAANDPESALAALTDAAKKYADEAYTPFGSAAAGDVAHVRGVCFYFLKDLPRAIQSYKSALSTANNPLEKAELLLRMALAYEASKDPEQAVSSCETALSDEPGSIEPMQVPLESLWSRLVVRLSEETPLPSRSQEYGNWADRVRNGNMNTPAKDVLIGNCEANKRRVEEYSTQVGNAGAARERVRQAQEALKNLQLLPAVQRSSATAVQANTRLPEIDSAIAQSSSQFRQHWRTQYPSLCAMGLDVGNNGPVTPDDILDLQQRLQNLGGIQIKRPMGCLLPLAVWLIPLVGVVILNIVAVVGGHSADSGLTYLFMVVSLVGGCMGIYALVKMRDRKAWQAKHDQFFIAQAAMNNLQGMVSPIISLWGSRDAEESRLQTAQRSEEQRMQAERAREKKRLVSVIAAEQSLTADPPYPAPLMLA